MINTYKAFRVVSSIGLKKEKKYISTLLVRADTLNMAALYKVPKL